MEKFKIISCFLIDTLGSVFIFYLVSMAIDSLFMKESFFFKAFIVFIIYNVLKEIFERIVDKLIEKYVG